MMSKSPSELVLRSRTANGTDATGSVPFSAQARWADWRKWRLVISSEALLFGLSLYFVVLCNGAFWRALLVSHPDSGTSAQYILCVGIALVALQFLLFSPMLGRWTTKPLSVLLVLISATASYFSVTIGIYYNVDMLRNALRTDFAEARELITPGLIMHVLVLSAAPLLLIARVTLRRRALLSALLVRAAAFLLAAVVAVAALAIIFKDFSAQMRIHKEIRNLVIPAAPLWSTARVLAKDSSAGTLPRMPLGPDARLGATWQAASKPVLFIIVVGETVRAANWGLNAPMGTSTARQTTPDLARRDVINFTHVTSCGTSTEQSLPCMFSSRGRRQYDEDAIRNSENLLDILHRSGLRVIWNDNQSGCKGVCAGVESTRPDPGALGHLCRGDRCLDEALIESSRDIVRQAQGNLVLILHQIGNHGPAYFRRHPESFRRFMPTCDQDEFSQCTREQITNSYDNALLYTDFVLGRTLDLLQSHQARFDSAMVYVSDHGESLGENGLYLHGLPYAIAPEEQIRVPMMMWFSPGFASRMNLDARCLRARAVTAVSHDHLFHTLLGLLDVSTAARDEAMNIAAGCRSK